MSPEPTPVLLKDYEQFELDFQSRVVDKMEEELDSSSGFSSIWKF
jgi:hypothetical protein